MTQHAGHFEGFPPHTRLKHAILDSYIVAWAMKLLMWGRAGQVLAIVDAFAGPGRDKLGNPGSPVIAAGRAFEVMEAARTKKPWLDPRVHVFAIEATPTKHRALAEAMEPYRQRRPDLVHVYRGGLSDHIDEIVGIVGPAPAFYFLDPSGIKGMDAQTYPRALDGPHNEIFALFADIGANRLHGLVTAQRADAAEEIAAIKTRPSLFPELDDADIAAVERAAAKTNDALDASIPASRKHLTRALGSAEWVEELLATQARERPDAFLRLFRRALLGAGAQHILNVPMRNEDGHRVYSLVHASKSAAGFVTMKECVSTGLGKSELPREVTERIRTDLSIDIADLVETLRGRLQGQTVPWAAENNGLFALLLRTTALFNFQRKELKDALTEAGILRRENRKEICTFPPMCA